jgi:hypothetical protein
VRGRGGGTGGLEEEDGGDRKPSSWRSLLLIFVTKPQDFFSDADLLRPASHDLLHLTDSSVSEEDLCDLKLLFSNPKLCSSDPVFVLLPLLLLLNQGRPEAFLSAIRVVLLFTNLKPYSGLLYSTPPSLSLFSVIL